MKANNMKKFQNPSTGQIVETKDKAEIKKYKACGWKEIKAAKVYYAKGLQNGNSYLK